MKKWNELPVEIQEKMLEHQFTQTGKRNASVFERNINANTVVGGIDWDDTPENYDFWSEVTLGNFDVFYERYPKEEESKDKRFPLIAKRNRTGTVICYTDEKKGVVLSSKYQKKGECVEYQTRRLFEDGCWTIIAQPSEYPKEMYVSDEGEDVAIYEKNKQTIIAYSDSMHQYVDENTDTWSYAVNIPEEEQKEEKKDRWFYAVDITEEKQKSDLELELEELKAKVKEFEEKLHN